MFIKNNHIANQLYVAYTQNIRNLARSAKRMATGEKLPTAADGGGELAVADRWLQSIRGTDKLIAGMENAASFIATQDEVVRQGSEIIQRMSELAASALDTSKTTTDRIALDAEFQALEQEFADIATRKYNGVSLFGNSLSIRLDLASGETLVLSTISLAGISFVGMTLSQLASASNALVSLKTRLGSLNGFKALVGNNANEISRTLDFTRTYISELKRAEDVIRNIDLAIETGEFTKQQVILATSQSALSTANSVVQSALQFLG